MKAPLVLLLAACGPMVVVNPSPGPGPSMPVPTPLEQCRFDCSGCCTSAGVCLPGTALDACGWAGGDCNPCPADQSCELAAGGGRCMGCNAFTCSGCCTTQGLCVSGTADDACGRGGERCVSCAGAAFCSATGVGGGRCR